MSEKGRCVRPSAKRSCFLFGFLSLLSLSGQSLAIGFDNDYEERPWTEIEVQLPDFPEQENQIAFSVGAIDDTRFLIDEKSLSVGSDDVIRYTLTVVSSAGASNISYEGMRCTTGERRFYAFGRSDKTWSKARANKWVRIQGTSNNHHVDLYSNFFCTVGVPPAATSEDLLRVLRGGGNTHR